MSDVVIDIAERQVRKRAAHCLRAIAHYARLLKSDPLNAPVLGLTLWSVVDARRRREEWLATPRNKRGTAP